MGVGCLNMLSESHRSRKSTKYEALNCPKKMKVKDS